ncbi:MAG: hypothetical protein WC248_02260 [Candidatus Methanomethylophilaceae archaeon]|jgi:phage baseplate assembly protein W
MPNIGEGGDLLTNFSLRGGLYRCHSMWDLVTTITGDLALTKDEAENNRQRLLMWLALPKGERPDSPSLGCCLHDYFHAKIDGATIRRLRLDVSSDLKSVFPDLDIKNTSVESIGSTSTGNREIMIGVTLGDDDMRFIADFDNMSAINYNISSLLFYGGASI